MPNWIEVLSEITEINDKVNSVNAVDQVRRKYLTQIKEITGRNVIAYYSGWLQKPKSPDTMVNDKDKSGFMLTIHRMDKSLGLDLILHTPGGSVAATESLVDYLYSIFEKDVRVIVPQISMSAGTMIALSAHTIVMGKHSNLGPIDPQMGGVPCQGVLDEFDTAIKAVSSNPVIAPLWQTIISKYHPTMLLACKQSIQWSEAMVSKWLEENMCGGDKAKVGVIMGTFANHKAQKSHNRHIPREVCESVGLNIIHLEDNQDLQEAVLTTHHAYMHTFTSTDTVKIIENHNGIAYIESSVPVS